MNDRTWILGAGMTGLAAGMASGLAVLEAAKSRWKPAPRPALPEVA